MTAHKTGTREKRLTFPTCPVEINASYPSLYRSGLSSHASLPRR